MKYYVEDSLSRFPFWGQAKDNVKDLSEDDFDKIEQYINDCYLEEIPSDNQINNLIAYDFDFIRKEILKIDEYGNRIGSEDWVVTIISDEYHWLILQIYLEDYLYDTDYERMTEKSEVLDSFMDFIIDKNRELIINYLASDGKSLTFHEDCSYSINEIDCDEERLQAAEDFCDDNIIVNNNLLDQESLDDDLKLFNESFKPTISIHEFLTIITKNPIYGYEDGTRLVFIVEAVWNKDSEEYEYFDDMNHSYTIENFIDEDKSFLQSIE